jgi:hypothetical protein
MSIRSHLVSLMTTSGPSTHRVAVNVRDLSISIMRQALKHTGDGLRHFAYQKEAKFYNGVTLDNIHTEKSTINGIGAWSEKGIIGRGILLDYEAWREEHGYPLKDAFKTGAVTLSELKAVAEWEGVEIKFGDILIIRSGYMVQYYKSSHDDLKALSKILPPTFLGVEQSEEVLRWIWENFSAVAGDQPSFECWRTYSF